MTHWGKKNPVKFVFLLCVILDEGRKMAWPPSGTRMCSVSIAVFQQYFISVSEQTQNPTSVCLLFPFPKPALQNKASDKTTYVLYLNGLSSWHLYQINIHRKCRGLGRESQQDYCPSLGKYLTVQFQLFWILRFYHRVNVSFCDVKLYILPQYRLRISFFFWDEPCGGTTKRP